ncbi:PIG-L deacetylase family protein [Methyloparacoccus murrellii]
MLLLRMPMSIFNRRFFLRKMVDLPLCRLPTQLDLHQAKRALVFAPHPDDETIGCGGTLAQLAAICPVKVVLVTDGSGAGGLPPGSDKARRLEFLKALTILGIDDAVLLDFEDGGFEVNHQAINRIGAILRGYEPDWVFLPSPMDYHRDHIRISYCIDRCSRVCPSVRRLIYYETWAPLPASHVVDITDVAELKWRALSAHHTVLDCGDYVRCTNGLNSYRGLYLGRNRLAEAFYVESVHEASLISDIRRLCRGLLARL